MTELTIRKLKIASHKNAVNKGFYNDEKGNYIQRNDGELIALLHSELSELLEALRHGNPESKKIKGFSQAEEEMADLFIRACDMAEARGYRLTEAIINKMRYNEGRQYKHGKKF